MSHKRNEALRHVQHSMHHVIAAGEGSDRAPDSCKLCPYYRPDFKFRTCLYAHCPYKKQVHVFRSTPEKWDMVLRKIILPLKHSPKLLLIISTITITAGSKRKQNGCLPLNSGKHPGWKLNYSILNRCPENRVHIKPLTLPISENILIDEHEPVYTFHGRRSIIALTIRLHFLDG